ncbi:MAG: hypothetical protein PSX36_05825 [bacterium]|nr:hypothetical protein [bacterium]
MAAIRGMFVLRLVSTTLSVLLLLNIVLKSVSKETENPIILMALDNSSSMVAAHDSGYAKSELLTSLSALRVALQEKYSVKDLLFGNTAIPGSNPSFDEKETDMDALLNLIDNNYSNQNIGALILTSDGIYNKGANPLYSAEKLGFPIYTIATGDTNEIRDVQIQKINHNEIVYAGNNFPVEVVVQVKKFRDKEVRVKLWQNGVEKGNQVLKVNSEAFIATCSFTLSMEKAGIAKYLVTVTELEGEKNISNNSQSFLIESINNKEKILLLANAPHPDLSALREVLSAYPNYEIREAYFSEFNTPLTPYSLVILHGYSSAQSLVLQECKNKGIPFWIIQPKFNTLVPGINVNGASAHQFDDAEPYLNTTFNLFTLSDDLKKLLHDLPALSVPMGSYPVSNGTNSILKQRIGVIETENPIFFFGETNGLKFSTFVADGLWKWKFKDFAEHKNHALFSELIGKTIQYLSVKSDKSFFRLTAPKIIRENQNFEIAAEVYNKSYERIMDPEITLVLSNSDTKKFNYTFSKSSGSYHLNIGLLNPGDYTYEALANANGERYVKKGVLAVKEVIAEKINTVANHQILYQIARRSGAKLYYPTQIESLSAELLKNERIKPITYSQSSTLAIIEIKWLFWIILLTLAIEWFFRKRYLSI